MAKLTSKLKKAISSYIKEINSICPIDKAIVYGSYASHHAGARSDIDLAIFSKAVDNQNRLRVMTLYLKKVAKYKLDLQPLVFPYEDYNDSDNDFIINEIKKKGIEIYSHE
jgi:predicted nucleotidyltransferase